MRPSSVVAIWADAPPAAGQFNRTIEVVGKEQGDSHRLYRVTAETAARVSSLSSIPITEANLESYDDTYDDPRPYSPPAGTGHSPARLPPSSAYHSPQAAPQRTLEVWAQSPAADHQRMTGGGSQ